MTASPELRAMLGELSVEEYMVETNELDRLAQLLCGNGLHSMTTENTYIRPSGSRCCRACQNAAGVRRDMEKKNRED